MIYESSGSPLDIDTPPVQEEVKCLADVKIFTNFYPDIDSLSDIELGEYEITPAQKQYISKVIGAYNRGDAGFLNANCEKIISLASKLRHWPWDN